MEKLPGNYRTKSRKSVIGTRGILFFLLMATATLLSFSGSISAVVCLLWLGGLFSFFIMLAGMNDDITPAVPPRRKLANPASIESKRILKPTIFSPTFNE